MLEFEELGDAIQILLVAVETGCRKGRVLAFETSLGLSRISRMTLISGTGPPWRRLDRQQWLVQKILSRLSERRLPSPGDLQRIWPLWRTLKRWAQIAQRDPRGAKGIRADGAPPSPSRRPPSPS